MNKRELAILEKVFSAEMGGMPFQTKSKLAKKLAEDGMLENVYHVLPGRFPVRIEGYALTHAGRMAYCESCKDVHIPELDDD